MDISWCGLGARHVEKRMGRVGPLELLLILVVILFLFGAKRLPEIGEAIGKAIKEFKKASRDDDHHDSAGSAQK